MNSNEINHFRSPIISMSKGTSRKNDEKKSSKLEFSHSIDEVFLAHPNLDYQIEEYLTVWFKRAYDILSFLMPAAEKIKVDRIDLMENLFRYLNI